MTIQEACEVLGVSAEADYSTARRAYRAAARVSHPDTASPEDQVRAATEMARVNGAWALLREHLRPPALESLDEGGPDRDPWATAVPPEPARRRSRPRPSLVAAGVAALVVVAGVGVAGSVALTGSAEAEKYVGACLTDAGDVVGCGDASAVVEVTGTSASVEDCEGQVFADGSGTTYFCTTPLDA